MKGLKIMDINSKLTEMGVTLPEAPAPAANYIPFLEAAGLVFISGQVSQNEKDQHHQRVARVLSSHHRLWRSPHQRVVDHSLMRRGCVRKHDIAFGALLVLTGGEVNMLVHIIVLPTS